MDKLDWKSHQPSAFVNAFYDPSLNAMLFPAGILQGMFFNAHRPMYMNFGGIGMAIGHEITHGFDDSGRRRDHSGSLQFVTPNKIQYLDIHLLHSHKILFFQSFPFLKKAN